MLFRVLIFSLILEFSYTIKHNMAYFLTNIITNVMYKNY